MTSTGACRIALVGDTMLARRLILRLEKSAEPLVGSRLGEVLRSADLTVANLESPLVDIPIGVRAHGFRGVGGAAAQLALVQVVTLANNHLADCGDQGIDQTLRVLRAAGIGPVGVGTTQAEANEPHRVTIRGRVVAVFGACTALVHPKGPLVRYCVASIEDPMFLERIAVAAGAGQAVVVSIHGGEEYVGTPPPELRQQCARCIEAGAQVVVTHHPHVLGGAEIMRPDTLVWYSLGDFIFDSLEPRRRRTGVLVVDMDGVAGFHHEFVPAWRADDFGVDLAPAQQARAIRRGIASVEATLGAPWYPLRYRLALLRALGSHQVERAVTLAKREGPAVAWVFLWSRLRLLSTLWRRVRRHAR